MKRKINISFHSIYVFIGNNVMKEDWALSHGQIPDLSDNKSKAILKNMLEFSELYLKNHEQKPVSWLIG